VPAPREEHRSVRDELVEAVMEGDVGVARVPANDVEHVVGHFLADLEHLGVVVYHVTMKAVSMLIRTESRTLTLRSRENLVELVVTHQHHLTSNEAERKEEWVSNTHLEIQTPPPSNWAVPSRPANFLQGREALMHVKRLRHSTASLGDRLNKSSVGCLSVHRVTQAPGCLGSGRERLERRRSRSVPGARAGSYAPQTVETSTMPLSAVWKSTELVELAQHLVVVLIFPAFKVRRVNERSGRIRVRTSTRPRASRQDASRARCTLPASETLLSN
jgi:hypothetical protein